MKNKQTKRHNKTPNYFLIYLCSATSITESEYVKIPCDYTCKPVLLDQNLVMEFSKHQ